MYDAVPALRRALTVSLLEWKGWTRGHRGLVVGRYINWPFVPEVVSLLNNFTTEAHALGLRVKFYYTSVSPFRGAVFPSLCFAPMSIF